MGNHHSQAMLGQASQVIKLPLSVKWGVVDINYKKMKQFVGSSQQPGGGGVGLSQSFYFAC